VNVKGKETKGDESSIHNDVNRKDATTPKQVEKGQTKKREKGILAPQKAGGEKKKPSWNIYEERGER